MFNGVNYLCWNLFFSLGVLGQARAMTLRPPFYLVDGCIIQKVSRHWLTEMSNGSEFTRAMHVVGGICSLLVSKLIISLCQWPAPFANINQSRSQSLQSERFSSGAFTLEEKNIKKFKFNHFNLMEKYCKFQQITSLKTGFYTRHLYWDKRSENWIKSLWNLQSMAEFRIGY